MCFIDFFAVRLCIAYYAFGVGILIAMCIFAWSMMQIGYPYVWNINKCDMYGKFVHVCHFHYIGSQTSCEGISVLCV